MYCVANHIISPLANGSTENFQAILEGKMALKLYAHHFPCVEPFCASLFEEPKSFTELCILSATQAIESAQIDASSPKVIFIISTTKGDNLQLLLPAKEIASHFKNPNNPIVVSNACISGVSAQIVAWRCLQSRQYSKAIVIGCDVQSQFIVSGFQSFKALSVEPCKPFDAQRNGLNLGEAAATMIWDIDPPLRTHKWKFAAGSMHNDANHISGPSRTGEGSFRCIQDVTQGCSTHEITAISVHGTATPYNDEMEAIALKRANLQDIPVLALKGYFGHTMGAAGVLETILSMLSLEHGLLIGNPRFEEVGTTYEINISKEHRKLTQEPISFVKLMSGFGGCNAAIRLTYC